MLTPGGGATRPDERAVHSLNIPWRDGRLYGGAVGPMQLFVARAARGRR